MRKNSNNSQQPAELFIRIPNTKKEYLLNRNKHKDAYGIRSLHITPRKAKKGTERRNPTPSHPAGEKNHCLMSLQRSC